MMNLWTIPLRVALTMALYVLMAFMAQAVRSAEWTAGVSVEGTKLAVLGAWVFGVLAIWSYGRKS